MGKPKRSEKMPEGADLQKSGSHETDNPVSSTPYPEQAGTGSGDPQRPGNEILLLQSGESGSEDQQQPAAESDKDKTHAQPSQKPVVIDRRDFFRSVSTEEELPEEKIEELVKRVIANRSTADNASLETGKMLLSEVFGGRLEDALSRNPKKDKSFSKICEHPEMDVDSTTLSRWVKAANLVNTFEKADKKFKNLTCSHYIALLSLKDDDNKVRLAEEAEKNRFSVRRLALEVDRAEPRPPKKLIDEISSKLGNPKALLDDKSLSDEKKWAKALKSEDREALITRVSNAKLTAERYITALTRFHTLLKEIQEEGKSKDK